MMKLPLFLDNLTKKFNTPKRRLQIFILGFVIIYFVWAFVFFNPLMASKKALINNIEVLQTKLTETTQKINTINTEIKEDVVKKDLVEKAQLTNHLQKIEQALTKAHLLMITQDDWIKLKKAVINSQVDIDNKIILQRIVDLPVQPWVPETVDKTDVGAVTHHPVYQHALEVTFQADYFSTVQYISRLEKLPWSLYWDSLNYKVLDYPEAQVTLKFHVFTEELSDK